MSEEVDFTFMQNVGQEINEILFNDPEQDDWINQVIDYYNENNSYPSDTIHYIKDYIFKKKLPNSPTIVDDISLIIQDDENLENLLTCIFFPSNEEYMENYEEEEQIFVDDTNNNEQQINIADLSPEEYFENKITNTMNTLYLSHDIAYALLKKFNWSQSSILETWFTKQAKILESLRIKLGSEMVPNLKSPLGIREAGNGECPLCLDDGDLLELYCGHKICKNCLIRELSELVLQNKVPVCRQATSKQICGAEIMCSVVKQYLNSEIFKKYQRLILKDEIVQDPEVKECPNGECDWIITTANSLPCHIGKCPKCCSVTCLKCAQGAHAPLIICDKIDEFTKKISVEMRELEQDQEAWFKREDRLKEYRKSNIGEVNASFEKELNAIKERQKKESNEELKRINELDKEVNILNGQIAELSRKQNAYIDQQKPMSEINIIKDQIEELRKQYDQKVGMKQRIMHDRNVNESERRNELKTTQKEQSLFIEALRDTGLYQRKMYEYEMSLNSRAYQNVSITSNDDDVVSTMTKKCPKCKAPIERNDGCNHMTCQICKYQFCYVCEEPWSTHKDYFVCPKYKKDIVATSKKGRSRCGIDFSNMNDKKYYPPPMSVEKRSDFMRWNNLYTQHNMAKEKYDKLMKSFSKNVDEKLSKGEKVLLPHKLCPRNRIAKVLEEEMNAKDAHTLAIKILNTILFAQSIQIWGYPSLYYMMKDPRKAKVFEFKLLQMGEQRDKIIELISNPTSVKASDFNCNFDVLNQQIEDILMSAETF